MCDGRMRFGFESHISYLLILDMLSFSQFINEVKQEKQELFGSIYKLKCEFKIRVIIGTLVPWSRLWFEPSNEHSFHAYSVDKLIII